MKGTRETPRKAVLMGTSVYASQYPQGRIVIKPQTAPRSNPTNGTSTIPKGLPGGTRNTIRTKTGFPTKVPRREPDRSRLRILARRRPPRGSVSRLADIVSPWLRIRLPQVRVHRPAGRRGRALASHGLGPGDAWPQCQKGRRDRTRRTWNRSVSGSRGWTTGISTAAASPGPSTWSGVQGGPTGR